MTKVIRQVFLGNKNNYFMVWDIPDIKLRELYDINNKLKELMGAYPNVRSLNANYSEYANCPDIVLYVLPNEYIRNHTAKVMKVFYVDFLITVKAIWVRFSCDGKNIETIINLDDENIFSELEQNA